MDIEEANDMKTKKQKSPRRILKMCFLVITRPKEENLKVKTLSFNAKASNTVYVPILFKQFEQ